MFKHGLVTVKRRFKEFLWLFSQLSDNNPGVIVPPAPDKHVLGTSSTPCLRIVLYVRPTGRGLC